MNSIGLAVEAASQIDEVATLSLKTGFASGQKSTESVPDSYQFFYFHPSYSVANILLNYAFFSFSRPQTSNSTLTQQKELSSPYDSSITNAFYLSFAPELRPSQRWLLVPSLTWARALQTAKAGMYFLNTETYSVYQNNTTTNQASSLGFELDFNATFFWDEFCRVQFESGVYFPGQFYAFENGDFGSKTLSPVFAVALRLGVNF
jgi:hypothetical protein